MRCLNCNREGITTGTEVCPQCGVHLPSLLRDVLPPGTTLNAGKYRIDHALGWGGFGITYVARHVALEQDVAVKEFYPRDHVIRNGTTGQITVRTAQHDSYERALRRFAREGQTLARLNHPNVIRVRDQFEENGTAYLVMELVSPARTLREVLDARPDKRLPDARVEQIAGQLVSALDAVHRAGVYHLDIKPDNVLMTPEGQTVLIDFGASRQGLTTKTTQAFTLEYAPPEVLSGDDVGPQSDLYELGVVLYEMLAGERPQTSLSRLTNDRFAAEKVEEPWRGLIAGALRLRMEERPASARAWWESKGSAPPRAEATQPPPLQRPNTQRPSTQQPHTPPPHTQRPHTQQPYEPPRAATPPPHQPPHASAHTPPHTYTPPPATTRVVAPPPVVAASGGGRRRALMVVVALLFLAALVTVIARVNRGANTNTYSGGYYGSNSSASGKPSNAGYGSYSTPTPGPAAPSVPTFTGYVGDTSGMRRFGTFLENSQREVVKIDVNLSDEQMSSLRSEGSGRLYIDLAYTDSDGYPEGDELMIDVSGGMGDLYLDERGTSQRLQGYIKVLGVQGPQQGIFSVLAKPVAIESIGRGGK